MYLQIKGGADVTTKNKKGYTALDVAVKVRRLYFFYIHVIFGDELVLSLNGLSKYIYVTK